MMQIIEEVGSFDKYIWGFVSYKPTVSNFRYPRQVPIKTSKADTISKDLVRRGFRGVGPTVVYSFMQVAGITNDHLVTCFRFQDCIAAAVAAAVAVAVAVAAEGRDKGGDEDGLIAKIEGKETEEDSSSEEVVGLERTIDVLNLST